METNLPMLFADAALVPFESPAGLHALVNPISGKYRIWILQIGLFFVIFGNPGPNKKKRKKNSHHSQILKRKFTNSLLRSQTRKLVQRSNETSGSFRFNTVWRWLDGLSFFEPFRNNLCIIWKYGKFYRTRTMLQPGETGPYSLHKQ